jgi:hypothetical protein
VIFPDKNLERLSTKSESSTAFIHPNLQVGAARCIDFNTNHFNGFKEGLSKAISDSHSD